MSNKVNVFDNCDMIKKTTPQISEIKAGKKKV
jgi:hypothetical protein